MVPPAAIMHNRGVTPPPSPPPSSGDLAPGPLLIADGDLNLSDGPPPVLNNTHLTEADCSRPGLIHKLRNVLAGGGQAVGVAGSRKAALRSSAFAESGWPYSREPGCMTPVTEGSEALSCPTTPKGSEWSPAVGAVLTACEGSEGSGVGGPFPPHSSHTTVGNAWLPFPSPGGDPAPSTSALPLAHTQARERGSLREDAGLLPDYWEPMDPGPAGRPDLEWEQQDFQASSGLEGAGGLGGVEGQDVVGGGGLKVGGGPTAHTGGGLTAAQPPRATGLHPSPPPAPQPPPPSPPPPQSAGVEEAECGTSPPERQQEAVTAAAAASQGCGQGVCRDVEATHSGTHPALTPFGHSSASEPARPTPLDDEGGRCAGAGGKGPCDEQAQLAPPAWGVDLTYPAARPPPPPAAAAAAASSSSAATCTAYTRGGREDEDDSLSLSTFQAGPDRTSNTSSYQDSSSRMLLSPCRKRPSRLGLEPAGSGPEPPARSSAPSRASASMAALDSRKSLGQQLYLVLMVRL